MEMIAYKTMPNFMFVNDLTLLTCDFRNPLVSKLKRLGEHKTMDRNVISFVPKGSKDNNGQFQSIIDQYAGLLKYKVQVWSSMSLFSYPGAENREVFENLFTLYRNTEHSSFVKMCFCMTSNSKEGRAFADMVSSMCEMFCIPVDITLLPRKRDAK